MRGPGRLKIKSSKVNYKKLLKEKDDMLRKLESDNRTLSKKLNASLETIQELEDKIAEMETELKDTESNKTNMQN